MKPFKVHYSMPLAQMAIMDFVAHGRKIRRAHLIDSFGFTADSAGKKLRAMAMAGRLKRYAKGLYGRVA